MATPVSGIAQPNGEAAGSARVYADTQPTEVQAAWAKHFPSGMPAEFRVRCQKNDRAGFDFFVVDNLPKNFYTEILDGNPPIFSSNGHCFCNPEVIVTQREYPLWPPNSIESHCDFIRKQYPSDVAQLTQPMQLHDLLKYYSQEDIYRSGPQNLWNVICALREEKRIKILDPQVQSWLKNSKNELKLKKWSETEGPILDILSKKDYNRFKVGAYPEDQLVLAHILHYQRNRLLLHKPQEERIEQDDITSTALPENSESRPVGEHVSGEHKIGLPSPPRLCEDSKLPPTSGNHPSRCFVENGCHKHATEGPMQPNHRHTDPSSAAEVLQKSVGEAKMSSNSVELVDNRTIPRIVVVNGTSSQRHPAGVVKDQGDRSTDDPSHQASVNGRNQKASTSPVMNAEPPKHIDQTHSSVDADYHAEPVAVVHSRASPSPLPGKNRLTRHDKKDGGDTLASPQLLGLADSAPSDPQQSGVKGAPNKMAEDAQTQHHVSTAVNVQPVEEPGHTMSLRKHPPRDAHGTRSGAQMMDKTNRAMRLPSHPTPMLQMGSSNRGASGGHFELPAKQDFFDNRSGSASYATYGHSMAHDYTNRPTGGGSVHHRHFSRYVDDDGVFQTQLSHRFPAAMPSRHQPNPDAVAATPKHDCETDPANPTSQFSRDGNGTRANYNNKSRRWHQNRRQYAGYPFQANRDQFHPPDTWETNTPQHWRRTDIAETHQGDPTFLNKRGYERSHRPEFGFRGKCQTERRQNMAQPPVRYGLPSPVGYLPNPNDVCGPQQNMVQYPMGYGMNPSSGYALMAHHTGGSQQTRPFHPGMQPRSNYREPHWVKPYPQGGQAHASVSYPAHTPMLPSQPSAQSSQLLPVHKRGTRSGKSNQNDKGEAAGVQTGKHLDCNAQSKPPSEEALDNDELIEQAEMSSSSQASQSSRASSLRIKVSLPTVSASCINQTLGPEGGEKNTQPVNLLVEQQVLSEKDATKEIHSSQVHQSATQQPNETPKSHRLAATKARETTAVTKVTVTSTNPRAISMFTEEEIRSRRMASDRIPIPLDPRQLKKTAPSKDNTNNAQKDKVDLVQDLSSQTGSLVSDPVQCTPDPPTVMVKSAGSKNISPFLAQDDIPRHQGHHNTPLNNETKHELNAGQQSHVLQSSNQSDVDYVDNHKSRILDCQALNGIGSGFGLPGNTVQTFQFPNNGRGTIRARGTDERGTVLHEAFGQMRDKPAKKGWRKNKLSRSIDFKSQNQPFHEQRGNVEKDEVPGSLVQVTDSTYSSKADPSVGSHERHPSVPQNTLNAGVRDDQGNHTQNVASSESNGGHGGSLKVQKRRRPQRKPQPFGAQGQLGDKADRPTAKAEVSFVTTDVAPSTLKATDNAHDQKAKQGDPDIRGGNESSASDPGAKGDATVKRAVTITEVQDGGTTSNAILKANVKSTPRLQEGESDGPEISNQTEGSPSNGPVIEAVTA